MPDTVIIGAGMAGLAAAYHLAARHGVRGVVLIDEREPLTLTSDKGTQGYRNWWPGPDATMCRFVSRSIDLLEEMADESGNAFRLSRRGYLFATARESEANALRETARAVSSYGMGPLREHTASGTYQPARPEGYRDRPDGADLLPDDVARAAFPYLAPTTVAALHVRRAGWMNAVALGDWLLRRALAAGVTFVQDRVDAIDTAGGRVCGVRLASGKTLGAERVVIAAGPRLPEVARLLTLDTQTVPAFLELHAKCTMRDPLGSVPRSAPFVIWNDSPSFTLDGRTLPGGVHVRPIDGPHGDELWLIWTFDAEPHATCEWPPRFDAGLSDVLLRGAAAAVPGLAAYAARGQAGVVDGGYYCKTPENRPLVGPLPVDGAYVIGALSGYGIMASHAAADLLALQLTGGALPDYAPAFLPARYDDASYRGRFAGAGALVGQL